MAGIWEEVARVAFKGPRFRDHALDLGALAELVQFQKMMAETAKALWRAANPDRGRLPPHFDERTRLCLRGVEEGSAVAPLEVFLEEEDPEQLKLGQDVAEPTLPKELRDAVALCQETYEAVGREAPLPDAFPRSLVPEYGKWAANLGAEESIEFHAPERPPTRVTSNHAKRLGRFQDRPHESKVELVGKVLEADVRRRRFQLWPDEQASVTVEFSEEQEDRVTTALKDHKSVRMRVKGTAETAASGKMLRMKQVDELDIQVADELMPDPSARPIEEVIAEIAAEVPEEEWAKLPRDASKNLDHYLYGGPKR